MSCVESFLTTSEEEEIIAAIRKAEQRTSGEIRVHIEEFCNSEISTRTKAVFHYLKMDNTKLQNGVLIYIAAHDKKFAVFGDEGINKVVANDFWELIKNAMQIQFSQQNYKEGIIDGVIKIGLQLETYFPWQHNDIDELPNTISKS